MTLGHNFFLIFVFLKQFYIVNSGFMQPGDVFFIISLVLYLMARNFKITINKIDKPLIAFIICIAIVNGLYFIIYKDSGFIFPILYYIFNLLVILLFREYSKNKSFLNKLLVTLKINIVVQFVVCILRIGRWYSEGRYMGTFNDPNQMAFFLFMTLFLMILTSKLLNKSVHIIYYGIVTFLVIETASTGILLGMLAFYILLFLHYFPSINFKFTLRKGFVLVSFLSIMIVSMIIIDIDFQVLLSDSFIIDRVNEKISKVFNPVINNTSSYSELSIIQERGIDKLLLYPERILFGAGEGLFWRFPKTAHLNEVHSTLPSILFYYGLFPFILLLIWFKRNIKEVNQTTIIIFIPLLIESSTLLNQRQPFFWMIFVLAFELYKKEQHSKKSYDNSHIRYKLEKKYN